MTDYQPISTQPWQESSAMNSERPLDDSVLESRSKSRRYYSNSITRMYSSSRPSSAYDTIDGSQQNHHKTSTDRRDDYKPFALRWPFLGSLLVSLLALMALLAYGLHLLPRKPLDNVLFPSQDGATERRGLLLDTTQVVTEGTTGTSTGFGDSSDLPTVPQTVTLGSGSSGSINTILTYTIITNSAEFGIMETSIAGVGTYSPDASIVRTDTSGLDETFSMTTSEAFGVVETRITQTLTSVRPSGLSGVTDGFGVIGASVTEKKASGTMITTTSAFTTSDTFSAIATSITKDKISVNTLTTPKDKTNDIQQSTESMSSFRVSGVIMPSSDHGDVDQSMTLKVEPIATMIYATAPVIIVTDNAGNPTYTSTKLPPAVSTPTTATLTNSVGQPTATIVTSALVPPVTSVLTNSDGIATKTVVVYPIPTTPPVDAQVFYISSAQYFVGFCLPTLLSILIALPIRALNMNAKLFQPWHELARPGGALGRESLNLPTSGLISYTNGLRALLSGNMVMFLTTILMMCSVLLVPLSAETIVLQLRGNCVDGSAKGCTYQLSVSEIPAKAAIALLAFMCVLVILIFAFLWRWKSGVYTNPWSICGMASLTQNRDVRELFIQGMKSHGSLENWTEDKLKSEVFDRRFKLDWFHNGGGKMEYGVMLWDRHSKVAPLYHDSHEEQEEASLSQAKDANRLPFMLGLAGTILFLSVLLGVLALIVYYNSTSSDTAFERFMDSQSFGTKFLFTSIGTTVTLFWSSFVGSKFNMRPRELYTDTDSDTQASPSYPHTNYFLRSHRPPNIQFCSLRLRIP